MFRMGMRRTIEEEDIYEVKNGMQSDRNTERFAELWQLELKKKNPSILRVIFKVFGLKFSVFALLFLVAETAAR